MSLFVTIFADASYCPDTGCYGWAVWIKYGQPAQTLRLTGSGWRDHPTRPLEIRSSDDAEKLALDTAVRALRHYKVPLDRAIVVLQSDSVSALAKVRTKPIKKLVAEIRTKHVKGHRGFRCARSSVNTWCDREARRKMRERRRRYHTEQETTT